MLFAAILSPQGGSRLVLKLGEAGLISVFVGRTVLAEANDVVTRKAPRTRPLLAVLLDAAGVEVGPASSRKHLASARRFVAHDGDAAVLAEALAAEADWLLTHDKRHLLRADAHGLPLTIGTPGDLVASLRETLIASTATPDLER